MSWRLANGAIENIREEREIEEKWSCPMCAKLVKIVEVLAIKLLNVLKKFQNQQ